MKEFDAFTRGYIEAALWSSIDENGDNLDNYGIEDLSPEALQSIVSDCETFQSEMVKHLEKAGNPCQNGVDFWLTRNGHGAGFWDRGYDKEVSDVLTEASKFMGECCLYVDEDGKVHFDCS